MIRSIFFRVALKIIKEHYLKDSDFNPNFVHTKSFTAAGLFAWVIRVVKFNEVYIYVSVPILTSPDVRNFCY